MKHLLLAALTCLSFAANASFYDQITTSVLDDDPDSIATSQSAGGAASLTLDGALASGGVATLPEAQPVRITSVADESGVVFTITGTDADGETINEDVTGANAGTADSTSYFLTITDVATDGATTGNVTVGTEANLGMVTKTLVVPREVAPFSLTASVELSAGTGTFGVQYTVDPDWGNYTDSYSVDANWQEAVDADGVGLNSSTNTASGNVNIYSPVYAVRGRVSTGSATGVYVFTFMQGGFE